MEKTDIYNDKLLNITSRWSDECAKRSEFGFVPDGIMGLSLPDEQANKPRIQSYYSLGRRFLIVGKEPYYRGGVMPDSSDNYSAFPIEYLLDNRFWRQCLRINMIVNLCLHERIKDGLPYCDNDNDEVLKLYFDKYPFAFCNIKKTVGGSNIKNKTLIDSSRTYIGYLREEVELLNPDVIYCCGDLKNTTKVVLDEVYGVPFTKVYTFSNGKGLWKHPDKDLLVIEGTHPSYQPKKSFDIYSSGLLECFSRKDNAHDGTIAEKSTRIYHDQAK